MSSLSIMSKRIKIHQYQAEIGNVDEENVVIFRDVTFMSVTVIIQDFLSEVTLEFLINAPVRLLIFDQFSHQYVLIRTSTFIIY